MACSFDWNTFTLGDFDSCENSDYGDFYLPFDNSDSFYFSDSVDSFDWSFSLEDSSDSIDTFDSYINYYDYNSLTDDSISSNSYASIIDGFNSSFSDAINHSTDFNSSVSDIFIYSDTDFNSTKTDVINNYDYFFIALVLILLIILFRFRRRNNCSKNHY